MKVMNAYQRLFLVIYLTACLLVLPPSLSLFLPLFLHLNNFLKSNYDKNENVICNKKRVEGVHMLSVLV